VCSVLRHLAPVLGPLRLLLGFPSSLGCLGRCSFLLPLLSPLLLCLFSGLLLTVLRTLNTFTSLSCHTVRTHPVHS
jgi:hypothetical protein